MTALLPTQSNSLSHAVLVVGDRERSLDEIETHLQAGGWELEKNPNYQIREYARMGIDDARDLQDRVSKTALGRDERKVFVVLFDSITTQAQNALLKTIEEPSVGTHLFFVVPSEHILLPTILSRVMLFAVGVDAQKDNRVQEFLQATFAKREKVIASFLADKKTGQETDRVGAKRFAENLLSLWWQKNKESEGSTDSYREYEELIGFLGDQSASVKSILEYFAVTMRD